MRSAPWRYVNRSMICGAKDNHETFSAFSYTLSPGLGIALNRRVRRWHGRFDIVDATEFEVQSPVRPFVGVHPKASPGLVDFLEAEGHIVERRADKGAYGVYLGVTDVSEERAKRAVIDQIQHSEAPLVRLWRWPEGALSCLAVTGDIDSVTLVDFFMRPFEV